jgi:hypothetical protein
VWYDTTAAAIAAGSAIAQVTNSRTWAIAWLAAARTQVGTRSATARRAALAGAVHQTLISLIPGQHTTADATLAAELAVLPDGPAVRDGMAAGRASAQRLLDERAEDGLDPASVNAAFPVPVATPGVWQPTPPQYAPATQYGNRVARPFVLRSAAQFRPVAPPAVGSRRDEDLCRLAPAERGERRRPGVVGHPYPQRRPRRDPARSGCGPLCREPRAERAALRTVRSTAGRRSNRWPASGVTDPQTSGNETRSTGQPRCSLPR